MRKTLKEELERIHVLTYGDKLINEQSFEDVLKKAGIETLSFLKKQEDPKKADLVTDDVEQFFNTLKDAASSGDLKQQQYGKMKYQKAVESMQIGLKLLGYELPRFGVDGLFGPETADAVEKFVSDHLNKKDNKADSEMLNKLIELLKQKGVTPEDLKKNTNVGGKVDVTNLTDVNFYVKLLENLGAKPTEENLKFLYAWRQSEGKSGKYNPFNTTWDLPGSTNFNKVGVKNYNSLEDGMVATIKTLKSGRYECIVDGLRNDIGAAEIAKCGSLKIWGTGDLVAKVISGYESGASPKVSALA